MCGFMNSILVTVPVSVTGLLSSNSTLNPWCATTGEANKSAEASAKAEKKMLRMNFLQQQFLRFICQGLIAVKVAAALKDGRARHSGLAEAGLAEASVAASPSG